MESMDATDNNGCYSTKESVTLLNVTMEKKNIPSLPGDTTGCTNTVITVSSSSSLSLEEIENKSVATAVTKNHTITLPNINEDIECIDITSDTTSDSSSVTSNTDTNNRNKKRKYRKHADITTTVESINKEQSVLLLAAKLKSFQYDHSYGLRISVSNIAALSGFHPWKELPELFLMDLVYQGSMGQLLLQRDMELLDIQSIDPEKQLINLATKTQSVIVQKLVQDALDVKKGTKIIPTIQHAQRMKQTLQDQKMKLNVNEKRILQQSVRHAIDTGYGTSHEKYGLDVYEQRLGYKVKQRNSEIRIWPFQLQKQQQQEKGKEEETMLNKNDNDKGTQYNCGISKVNDNDNMINDDNNNNNHFVAVPILPCAIPITELDNYHEKKERQQQQQEHNTSEPRQQQQEEEKMGNAEIQCDRMGNSSCTDHSSANVSLKITKPFFSILGSIDGIREEIVFLPQRETSIQNGSGEDQNQNHQHDDNEFDEMVSNHIIVECKHRMNMIQSYPPLYEQIQCVVYCLMYQLQDADLVQVLRTTTTTPTTPKMMTVATTTDTNTTSTSKVLLPPQSTQSPEFSPRHTKKIRKNETKNRSNQQQQQQHKSSSLDVKIHVTRISLRDPIHQHEQCWNEYILPRLTSIVQGVYKIRQKDHDRYRLLHAVARGSSTSTDEKNTNHSKEAMKDAYHLLFEIFPWLKSCDTSYHRI